MNQINTITTTMSGIIKYCREKRCTVKINESLKDYTSFKIGGTANIVVFPDNKKTFIDLLKIIKDNKTDYILLGNGSNVLICENNFDGVVIVTSQMNNIIVDGENIHANCGVSLNKLANTAKENSLSGLEFAYGIPGTLGGAIYMNAGAYGGQISDVVYSSEYFDLDALESCVIGLAEHEFGYRRSIFNVGRDVPGATLSCNKLILSSVLKLKNRNITKTEIESVMNKNMSARKEKQPLEYPSAGSVFKRGNGFFTAKLIEECGLKGYAVGGAQVSEKHAGFIINKSNATFSDVVNLIEHIKSVVYDKTGNVIECEVKIIEF